METIVVRGADPRRQAAWGTAMLLLGLVVGVLVAFTMARLRRGAADDSDVRACRLAWRRFAASSSASLHEMPNPYGRHTMLIDDTNGATRLPRMTLAREIPSRGVVIAARASELLKFDDAGPHDVTPFSRGRRAGLTSAVPSHTTRASTMVPIRWADPLGVFLIKMRIGETDVRLAVDSGSSMCVVGTDGCRPSQASEAPRREARPLTCTSPSAWSASTRAVPLPCTSPSGRQCR